MSRTGPPRQSAAAIGEDLAGLAAKQGFTPPPISIAHAQRARLLPGPRRDPFDRVLIAQAHAEDLALISNDGLFDAYGVRRVW